MHLRRVAKFSVCSAFYLVLGWSGNFQAPHVPHWKPEVHLCISQCKIRGKRCEILLILTLWTDTDTHTRSLSQMVARLLKRAAPLEEGGGFCRAGGPPATYIYSFTFSTLQSCAVCTQLSRLYRLVLNKLILTNGKMVKKDSFKEVTD